MTAALGAARGIAALSLVGLVAACSSPSGGPDKKYGVTASPRLVPFGKPIPEGGGYYKVGKPYKVAGRWYRPKEDAGYDQVGLASWYGRDFHGRKTANGEVFDMADLSAAHPTLPLPTYARVTNLENGRSVVVRINDRGPFAHNRLIDVSKRTAELLDFHNDGTAKVRVQYVGMAPLEGNDGQWLTTTVRHDGQPVGPVMLAGLSAPAAQQASAGRAMQPPPPPPGTSAPYPQTTVAFSPSTYAADVPPTPEPVSASFTPSADGPVPKVPVGTGKVTYRWVQGYAEREADAAVARAFSIFDTERDIVLIFTGQPTNPSDNRTFR
ncbi:septal ring lytic transglycosylase RlpA family protein [Microbaculum marinisediminis]|uniref:Endolytic peptidoglycan transglycosylase RlpA n=1 Tax=Microbaculum marinisediminis TaxID=2931392 RepID=A0AAW5R6K7_9HYPH|nr:septal ring lytic transglycosylase RlpA family protein [Microbaculum sp. A6E488]MCT8974150.1 septal ring lytic transglycosylase RlpA family protein [Microbaculum sp. A6E488]